MVGGDVPLHRAQDLAPALIASKPVITGRCCKVVKKHKGVVLMRSNTRQYAAQLVLLMLTGFVSCVQAETMHDDPVFDTVSVFAGQGADHNLREIPGSIVAGKIAWEKSYFKAAGLGKTHGTVGEGWERLEGTLFAGILRGHEVVLVQHHGMQDNAEIGAAYTLKTPDLELGAMGVNFGSGIGLSYALGTPSYEDGPKDDPARRYRLQLLLLFDFEWRINGLDEWSLVTRVHHRSGVYGMIAPPHVGSNFMAAGIRYRF
jgi:hypothetical protein